MNDPVTLLHRFVDQTIYNGAEGAGQAIYNEGGNPWLHEQIDAYFKPAKRYDACPSESYFQAVEQMDPSPRLQRSIDKVRAEHRLAHPECGSSSTGDNDG